jgi:hypothetical protein
MITMCRIVLLRQYLAIWSRRRNRMVAHGTQRFILVRGAVHAKPYSSGAAALVFICLIIGAVAPSYEVDGIGIRLDSEPEVPTLFYIGRRVRVTERMIGLTDCFLVCYNRLILTVVQIYPSWFVLISTLVDRVSPCKPPWQLLGR